MDALAAIVGSLRMADMVSLSYLKDLDDTELMQRPHPACNHINWQVGHLVVSEHQMISQLDAAAQDPLPEGLAEKYSKETASSDDAGAFAKKEELLALHEKIRAKTIAYTESLSAEQLDEPTGVEYAPTRGDMLRLQAEHWLMHCGQWVIVRRANDKPIAF